MNKFLIALVSCTSLLPACSGAIPSIAWIEQFGTAALDEGFGVAVDSSNNVFVSGSTYGALGGPNAGDGDIFVRKFDSAGTPQWTKQYGTAGLDVGYDIQTNLGNAYLAGIVYGDFSTASLGQYDAYAMKISGAGTEIWREQFGTTENDFAFDLSIAATGAAYLVGDNSADVDLRKLSTAGLIEWTRQLGTPQIDSARGVGIDGAGNVYVGGTTLGVLGSSSQGGSDFFVAKYSEDGNQQWIRQAGSTGGEFLTDIAVDATGNFFLTGQTSGAFGAANFGGSDAVLTKFDLSGLQLWSVQIGSDMNDIPNAIAVDLSGNIFVAGHTFGQLGEHAFGNMDAFVSKFTSDGSLDWTLQLGTASIDAIYGLSVDAQGVIYVTGRTNGVLGNQAFGAGDVFVAKIVTVPESLGIAWLFPTTLALIASRRARCD